MFAIYRGWVVSLLIAIDLVIPEADEGHLQPHLNILHPTIRFNTDDYNWNSHKSALL
jgi:hypothetical protein